MKTKESYKVFLNIVEKKIEHYSNELHFSIGLCSTLNGAILNSTNKEIIDYFKDIDFLSSFNRDYILKLDIEPSLHAIIKTYYSYVHFRIPYLNTMLDNYMFISSIPYDIYYEITGKYNTELSKFVLLGEKVTLSKLGNLRILYKHKKVNKLILDYKKTKENKKYFEENNIKEDYRVYNTNDEFLYFIFSRFPIIRNLEYYNFKPTTYINLVDRKIENYYASDKTEDDIINNIKLGNIQKANALVKQNAKYKLRYIQNAN